ncbi:MAG TPA: acetyl-CoA carboxylase biotin carboxyl carrier protein subunit [Syntrophus sp. (in: bacteria)]|jgi:biotin carboxyl carrier protein|nr:acetyl-CoA carboxylase biotin carboxyl carrier protein subunit [Syntrophus sp. (in: bacteria)]
MKIELTSPIPGKIMKVLVGVGDVVNEDDEVMKIESMKMENPVYAPAAGTITAIGVRENDEVEVDDLLLVIEEGG